MASTILHTINSASNVTPVRKRREPQSPSSCQALPSPPRGQKGLFPEEEHVPTTGEEVVRTKAVLIADDLTPVKIPVEVTVIEELSECGGTPQKASTNVNERLEIAQAEAKEYLHQLHSTLGLVDQLTSDIRKSRSQVAQLINQNTQLLEELKAVAGQDDASLEERQMLRQELNMLKGCLFFGAIFVLCGGRVDVIGIVAFVWFVADIST